jgi:hypothetical protein
LKPALEFAVEFTGLTDVLVGKRIPRSCNPECYLGQNPALKPLQTNGLIVELTVDQDREGNKGNNPKSKEIENVSENAPRI